MRQGINRGCDSSCGRTRAEANDTIFLREGGRGSRVQRERERERERRRGAASPLGSPRIYHCRRFLPSLCFERFSFRCCRRCIIFYPVQRSQSYITTKAHPPFVVVYEPSDSAGFSCRQRWARWFCKRRVYVYCGVNRCIFASTTRPVGKRCGVEEKWDMLTVKRQYCDVCPASF